MTRRAATAGLVALALAFAAAGCGASNASNSPPGNSGYVRTLADIIGSESPSLLAIPGVMAVREGYDEDGNPAIVVVVDKVTAEHRKRIPTRLQNVPVVIEPTTSSR